MNYDILVVGSGIGGMESALKLGDMGYRVLLVEKEPSVGGKMILLSKVFPTLDCASCISTPKMAASVHHPNVTAMIYSEVEQIKKDNDGKFNVSIRKKPTFVDPALCTGCRQCEMACNVAVPDQYNSDMVSRRAAYIAFPQAVPKKAVIEKQGASPCNYTCPAGIRAHGYVALVRTGKYREAYQLVQDATPLVGSLGKACYAPCEGECTRSYIEGPLPIRRIKGFIAGRHYGENPEPETVIKAEPNGKKVAVVGSGPAGLTAAFHLARKGYRVKIFEALNEPGGMLRFAVPSYRLPREVVDRDIKNVTALEVEIETGIRVENIEELKKDFDAVFLATGTQAARKMEIEGEDLQGVIPSLDFLRDVSLNKNISLKDKTVVVVGGGNVAVDSARVALRLGAGKVIVQYRRSRKEMPAHDWEIDAAQKEGVQFQYLAAPVKLTGNNGKLAEVVSVRMELGEADSGGRRKPCTVKGSEFITGADLIVTAVGLKPDTNGLGGIININKNETISVDPDTLQTSLPYVFAGGDAVTGPSMIVNAVGHGRRAAFFIDLYLRGSELKSAEYDYKLPSINKDRVINRQKSYKTIPPVETGEILTPGVSNFNETEPPLTEEEAVYSAGRCLDCGVCSECGQCAKECPAGAINMAMKEEKLEVEVNSVIVSTGFNIFPADRKPQYGKSANVITGMQMDRLLAPTRPYNTVIRPGDGKVPDNIAYILCAGSRDQTVNNRLCSRVCCMYSVKQNQLIMGALPLADVTVYYMDIRAFSKGYDEFYEQARAMGANFIRGRVAKIEEQDNGNLALYYEDIDSGKVTRADHDLVVLSVGMLPNTEVLKMFNGEKPETDEFFFIKEVDEDINPGKTSIDGVFVAGAASGARDIPDTILHAGAAAAQAAAYVERTRVLK